MVWLCKKYRVVDLVVENQSSSELTGACPYVVLYCTLSYMLHNYTNNIIGKPTTVDCSPSFYTF